MTRVEYSTWAGMIVTQYGRIPGSLHANGMDWRGGPGGGSQGESPPKNHSAALDQLQRYYGTGETHSEPEDFRPGVRMHWHLCMRYNSRHARQACVLLTEVSIAVNARTAFKAEQAARWTLRGVLLRELILWSVCLPGRLLAERQRGRAHGASARFGPAGRATQFHRDRDDRAGAWGRQLSLEIGRCPGDHRVCRLTGRARVRRAAQTEKGLGRAGRAPRTRQQRPWRRAHGRWRVHRCVHCRGWGRAACTGGSSHGCMHLLTSACMHAGGGSLPARPPVGPRLSPSMAAAAAAAAPQAVSNGARRPAGRRRDSIVDRIRRAASQPSLAGASGGGGACSLQGSHWTPALHTGACIACCAQNGPADRSDSVQ